jgi:hypothetical protein
MRRGARRLLGQLLGQLLEQAVLANQVFGFLAVGRRLGKRDSGMSCFFVPIVSPDKAAVSCQ